MDEKKKEIDYQFVAVPLNLFYCLDNNLRSMLFTLIQMSTYKENDAIEKGKEWNGWFLSANRILADNSNLSENLVRVTLDTLYQNGIISILSEGKGKGNNTPPNKIKINWERFKDFEKESIEDCIQDPRLAIETLEYSGSHYHPSYLKQEKIVRAETVLIDDKVNVGANEMVMSGVKIEDNIYNIDNKNDIDNIDNLNNIENTDNSKSIEINYDIYKDKNTWCMSLPTEMSLSDYEKERLIFELYQLHDITSIERKIDEIELKLRKGKNELYKEKTRYILNEKSKELGFNFSTILN